MIKANPSPKGNGFAFNLFGDPNGFPPLVKGKANAVCEGFAVRGLASEPKGSTVL